MKTNIMTLKKLLGALLSLSLFAALPAQAGSTSEKSKMDQQAVKKMVKEWPETSKQAANDMMEKYGEPDEATQSRLTWFNNGPWKRTVVYSEEVQHDFPMPHKDVLEQFVNMDVPADKFDDLANYDGSVIAERTKGEISARCDNEAANFLAINLAKDIVEGKKSVEEARKEYASNIKLMLQGEPKEYMQGLQFEVATNNINNPDTSVIEESERKPASVK